MSYGVIQTGVTALIKNIAGYDANNVNEDDFRAIKIGRDKFAIVRRGDNSSREFLTMGNPTTVKNVWSVLINVFVPFSTGRADVSEEVNVEAQRILDELDKWPKLNGVTNVTNAEAKIVNSPDEYKIGNSMWWVQDIEVLVDEIVETTLSE